MSRRGRRSNGTSARDFVTDSLANHVESLMENRHRLLLPFPIEPLELYNSLWTVEELNAIELLKRRHGSVLATSRWVALEGINPGGGMRISIRVHFADEWPEVGGPYALTVLPDEMQAKISEWVGPWLAMKAETVALKAKVVAVGRACKTYGQVARVWPDLVGFFGEHGRDKLHGAKMKSPLPNGVLYNDGLLFEEFEPKAFEPFVSMIAECLMLPMVAGAHVATIIRR